MATVRLADLLPTNGFLLPYALSLFLASLVLTFAGAFLTLDRTRSFAPVGDLFQDRKESTARVISSFIRGGVGGILTGFAFGIHLTTFLSLLIPSVTTSQPLKPASYLSVWLLSSLFTLIAAGRWKYFGLAASGFCGGTSIALAVSVAIHPSLLTRIALVAIFASTLAVLVPLPIARLQPVLLRASSSAVGSFGLILSIALFFRIEPWSNVWERLWVHDDIRWGSAQEKGLCAGFFLFLASGTGVNWWLRSKFGENPDQKWDSYLAQYVANLPVESTRAGIFRPLVSIWGKPSAPFKNSEFEPSTPSEESREKDLNFVYRGKRHNKTRKGSSRKPRGRDNIKFRPFDDGSTDSDVEEKAVSREGTCHPRPWLSGTGSAASTHSLTPTVLDDEAHSHVGEKGLYQTASPICRSTGPDCSDLPDYSDHEVDITLDLRTTRQDSDWVPRFLQNKTHLTKSQSANPLITPPLDQSVSSPPRLSQENPVGHPRRHNSSRWQTFWGDVNERVQHKASP